MPPALPPTHCHSVAVTVLLSAGARTLVEFNGHFVNSVRRCGTRIRQLETPVRDVHVTFTPQSALSLSPAVVPFPRPPRLPIPPDPTPLTEESVLSSSASTSRPRQSGSACQGCQFGRRDLGHSHAEPQRRKVRPRRNPTVDAPDRRPSSEPHPLSGSEARAFFSNVRGRNLVLRRGHHRYRVVSVWNDYAGECDGRRVS